MKKFFLFLAACVALVACQKNEADVNVPARQITIHATANVDNDGAANGPHRIAPNDITASSVSFHWQEGDKVWLISGDFSEMEIFTIDASSINGNQADFTGTALSDMSGYYALYSDNDMSEDLLITLLNGRSYTLDYNLDNQNWVFVGGGNEIGFTLSPNTTVRMQLKGSCKLGKVEFLPDPSDSYHSDTYSVNFVHGTSDGLQLTSTPVEVTIPVYPSWLGFALRFYDPEGNLIMKKSQDGRSLYDAFDAGNLLVNLGVLEVKKSADPTYAPVLPTSGRTSCEYVQLKAGGPQWATFNVGATITDYANLVNGAESTTFNPGIDFAAVCNTANVGGLYPHDNANLNGRTTMWENVQTLVGVTGDVATYLWGSNWRVPTPAELQSLCGEDHVWTWCDGSTTQYVAGCTLKGYMVSGKGDYADKSIFLPVTGFCLPLGGNYGFIANAGEPNNGGYYFSNNRNDNTHQTTTLCCKYSSGALDIRANSVLATEYGGAIRAVYDPN